MGLLLQEYILPVKYGRTHRTHVLSDRSFLLFHEEFHQYIGFLHPRTLHSVVRRLRPWFASVAPKSRHASAHYDWLSPCCTYLWLQWPSDEDLFLPHWWQNFHCHKSQSHRYAHVRQMNVSPDNRLQHWRLLHKAPEGLHCEALLHCFPRKISRWIKLQNRVRPFS